MSKPFSGKEAVYFIEPTNICNLNCEMCPTNREMKRKKGFMDYDIYRRTIDSFVEAKKSKEVYLNLWGWGEPLLHPMIYEMIGYAKKRGVIVRMSSNLDVKSANKCENIVNSGLDVLLIGLDGMTQESHGKYRTGGNKESVVNNIKEILRIKREHRQRRPIIAITTILTRYVKPELESLFSFCENSGVDALLLKLPNLWRSGKEVSRVENLYEKFIIKEVGQSRYGNRCPTSIDNKTKKRCPFLDKRGIVYWNGDVTVCCFDHEGDCRFGNIGKEGGIKNILHGRRGYEAWSRMKSNDYIMCEYCDSCGERMDMKIYTEESNIKALLKYL